MGDTTSMNARRSPPRPAGSNRLPFTIITLAILVSIVPGNAFPGPARSLHPNDEKAPFTLQPIKKSTPIPGPIYFNDASIPGHPHISSGDGSFGAICHYHKLNRNRLQKLRSQYLAAFIDRLTTEIARLDKLDTKDAQARQEELEGNLESARELDTKLSQILVGDPYRIHVPWKSDDEQPQGWDPDIDDGVKVNIAPFEEAGAFPIRRVT